MPPKRANTTTNRTSPVAFFFDRAGSPDSRSFAPETSPEPLVALRKHIKQASHANNEIGLALQEHVLVMLESTSSKSIPLSTKFHVLWTAEKELRVTSSTKIREASEQLAQQLGWRNIFIHRILHRVRRALDRWKESISKRILNSRTRVSPWLPNHMPEI
jgi:hypothetical protein